MNTKSEKAQPCRAELRSLAFADSQKKANDKSMYGMCQNVMKKAISAQFALYEKSVERIPDEPLN